MIDYNCFERGIKNLTRIIFKSDQFCEIVQIIFFFQIPVVSNCSSVMSNFAIYFEKKKTCALVTEKYSDFIQKNIVCTYN